MAEVYSVVMTGKIVDGFDVEQVKTNVGQLFKLTGEQLEKMFSGKPVAVQRGVDKEQALKLRSALAKAGALAAVKAVRQKESNSSEPKAAATEEKDNFTPDISCPRCGHQQSFVTACSLCKMDLTLHIQRLRRKEQMRTARSNKVVD